MVALTFTFSLGDILGESNSTSIGATALQQNEQATLQSSAIFGAAMVSAIGCLRLMNLQRERLKSSARLLPHKMIMDFTMLK